MSVLGPLPRPADLRLAGIHLRMGAHQLARAELEALAGADALDPPALLDLADARWRTGDLHGAGVAAQAYLGEGGEDPLAFVIAAEASQAAGRSSEARQLAAEAARRTTVPLDRLFAGMPRSGVWPIGPDERPEPVAELFPAAPWAAAITVPSPTSEGPGWLPGSATGAAVAIAVTADAESAGLWEDADLDEGPAAAGSDQGANGGVLAPLPSGVPSAASPRPTADELAAAWAELATGQHELAAVRLGIVLRRAPGLASAVLDAIAAAPPPGHGAVPALELVRGDAFRAAGRELEAQAAWRAAAAAVAAEESRPPSAAGPTPHDPRAALEHDPSGPAAADAPAAGTAGPQLDAADGQAAGGDAAPDPW